MNDDEIELCWQHAQSIPTELQMAGIHGILHWRRVQAFGLKMAEYDSRIDKTVIRLFACFHDFQRKDNGRNFDHGPKAAEALLELRKNSDLLNNLREDQFRKLVQAVREHTARTKPSGDITIDTCLDADRLDLGRCNITPDPARMLTPKGKEFAKHPIDPYAPLP